VVFIGRAQEKDTMFGTENGTTRTGRHIRGS
jgi:hypothetical protein